ncbi:MAG: GNAT family N-acetyltransferase [Theionarchaea archaeon]|nr:GNAT family N-acetyltransferase [Theionarchaea archaeon]
MIKRLRVLDTDQFIDILDDSFIRELKHMGGKYGLNKKEMKITYFLMRLLQTLFGAIRDIPDICAYYEEDKVLGVTKIVPYNARKDHWYSEVTAVRKNIQKKGTGTALKEYTVSHYRKNARRLFGNVREENIPMLKTNTRVGYKPYTKKVLLTRSAPHRGKNLENPEKLIKNGEEVEGFRPFKKDEKGVYNLYMRRTPEDVARIEDKTSEDFEYGSVVKLLSLLKRLRGKRDRKFVIERGGSICAYFWFEDIGLECDGLEILLDPRAENLSELVRHIVSLVSPDRNVICYVPEYRDAERNALMNAGFELGEVYISMVVECDE